MYYTEPKRLSSTKVQNILFASFVIQDALMMHDYIITVLYYLLFFKFFKDMNQPARVFTIFLKAEMNTMRNLDDLSSYFTVF